MHIYKAIAVSAIKHMNASSHYYAILAYARATGFTKQAAHSIAYASQFVDDAVADLIWLEGEPSLEVEHVLGRVCLHNMATCQDYLMLETLTMQTMILNTTAFHFVPCCSGDSFEQKMVCRPESPVALALAEEALDFKDPVRLGMLLHVVGDTYTHQGFSGIVSELNDICIDEAVESPERGWREMLQHIEKTALKQWDRLIPPYGHVMAGSYPDEPYATWSYHYDGSYVAVKGFQTEVAVNNPTRFLDAFKAIAGYLARFGQAHPEFLEGGRLVEPDLKALGEILVERANASERIERWKRELVSRGWYAPGDPALSYDSALWLREAFANFDKKRFSKREVALGVPTPGFSESRWYSFYRASRWYKARFAALCRENGLVLPL